jgi:hypothetical protein
MPRPGTFKQYRCENCYEWLTIDIKSRMKLIVVSVIGLMLFSVMSAYLAIGLKLPVSEHPKLALVPFAIVYAVVAHNLLSRYMRKIARWVSVDFAF